ncbi:MAG: PEP-CTERM sorting domain-containing protein [Alphaproteobacteria bacterium]
MKISAIAAVTFATAASMAATVANAAVLTFDQATACGGGCTNSSYISQAYGDSADYDLTYRSVTGFGNSAAVAGVTSLHWWNNTGGGFGDLIDVAYAYSFQGSAGGPFGDIGFSAPASGFQTELVSIDLGGYPYTDRPTQLVVYNGDYSSLLYDSGLITAPGVGHLTVAINLVSTGGLHIQTGGDAFDVGIDNIVFYIQQTGPVGVPEPMMLSLLGAGLAGMFVVRRKRT